MNNISWDDYKIAYQVAIDGSLSQAGKSLSINHATVLRRINQLEAALDVKLFFRHQRGYQLTDAGHILMEEMPSFIAQFSRLENQLHNVEGHLRGELRISTVSSYSSVLTPLLKLFRQQYPDIRLKLLCTDDIVPLESGIAHVALRVGPKPDGSDLIVKPLSNFATSYYVSQAYADEFGLPANNSELKQHKWVLPTSEKHRIPFVRNVLQHIDEENIVFQSNHFPDVTQAVIEGIGIGPISLAHAKLYDDLVYVPIDAPKTDEAIWFVQHKDLKHSARVRCFYDFLVQQLTAKPQKQKT